MAELVFILAVVILGFVISLILIKKWLQPKSQVDSVLAQWLQSTNEALRGSSSDINRALQENTKQLNDRLDNAAQVIGAVNRQLGEMSEVGRGIKSLQDFLQSPKLRGGIGEQILAEMIGQTFPKNSFFLQYSFKSGVKVDAAIKTDAGLLCIDSKFPMENFQNLVKGEAGAKPAFISDVKKHLSDISKKYILPEEGTMDFALMYIPSESVYSEIVNMPEITRYAQSLRVYPVSPNTLYAHLQVLLVSFQGKELESKSKEVFKLLRAIQKDYSKLDENLGILNRHVTNSFNQMSNVTSSFGLLGQKINQTNMLSDGKEE